MRSRKSIPIPTLVYDRRRSWQNEQKSVRHRGSGLSEGALRKCDGVDHPMNALGDRVRPIGRMLGMRGQSALNRSTRLPQTNIPSAVLLITAVCCACIIGGCGRKTDPRPPDMVAPAVIQELHAANSKDGVLLSWDRPSRYADGERMLDLGGFRIERSTAGGPFGLLTIREVTDRTRFRQIRNFRYVDAAVSEGEVYRYRILSFTTDGYFSQPSPTVEIVRRAEAAEK